MLAGLGESLCFSALPKLQPALDAAGLPCTSSSVTEGLMTATQSGATGLQLQFLPERWWEGDEMDRASATSTFCRQHLLPLRWDRKQVWPRAAACENTKNCS